MAKGKPFKSLEGLDTLFFGLVEFKSETYPHCLSKVRNQLPCNRWLGWVVWRSGMVSHVSPTRARCSDVSSRQSKPPTAGYLNFPNLKQIHGPAKDTSPGSGLNTRSSRVGLKESLTWGPKQVKTAQETHHTNNSEKTPNPTLVKPPGGRALMSSGHLSDLSKNPKP